MSLNISAISFKEFPERPPSHQPILEDEDAQQGTGHAQGNVYDIMVSAIDGSAPNAYHNDIEQANEPTPTPGYDGIGNGNHHVGRMERGNGGKDIGVAPVEAFEYGDAQHFVKASQPGGVARRTQDGLEAIIHGIPRWGSGMDVVSNKTDEVDQEENHGETQVGVTLALEVEVDAEGDGHGYPAEIKDARHEVGNSTMMLGKIFTGYQSLATHGDAEE